MFGVVVPNFPMLSNFIPIPNQQNKWIMEIDNRSNEIRELIVFMLPTAPEIPQGFAVTLYIADASQNFEYVGYMLPNKKSALIHVPASFEKKQTFFELIQNQQHVEPLFIGVMLEDVQVLQSLENQKSTNTMRFVSQVQELSQYIAKNLFNYLSSFTKPIQIDEHRMQEMIVCPTNVLDSWFLKFQNRLKLDPYFWQRESQNSTSR